MLSTTPIFTLKSVEPYLSDPNQTPGEILKIVEPEARALLREWKRKLLEGALEQLVEGNYGPRWQKRRRKQATPWICLSCGPRDSTQVKRPDLSGWASSGSDGGNHPLAGTPIEMPAV